MELVFLCIYTYVYVCVHFLSHSIKECNKVHMYSAHSTTDVDSQRGEALDGSETNSHKETEAGQVKQRE